MNTPFLPVPDPVCFTVFGIDIMWYAVMITTGMVLGTLLSCKRASNYGFTDDNVLDVVLWGIPCAIVGARLYYVIFEWENYKNDLPQILNIRGGGLAIHGGLIAGLGVAAILVRRWKQKPLDWIDLFVPGIALGQAIGRWGNYFNSEAHGGPCDLPWAIECQGELVHPTFLYESVWCLLLCIGLLIFEKKRGGRSEFSGQLALLYAFFYSIERFYVEGLRTDSLWIGRFRQAQVISVVTVVCAVILYFVLKRKSRIDAVRAASDDIKFVTDLPEEKPEETAGSEEGEAEAVQAENEEDSEDAPEEQTEAEPAPEEDTQNGQ